jgi:hypothetical protein
MLEAGSDKEELKSGQLPADVGTKFIRGYGSLRNDAPKGEGDTVEVIDGGDPLQEGSENREGMRPRDRRN